MGQSVVLPQVMIKHEVAVSYSLFQLLAHLAMLTGLSLCIFIGTISSFIYLFIYAFHLNN